MCSGRKPNGDMPSSFQSNNIEVVKELLPSVPLTPSMGYSQSIHSQTWALISCLQISSAQRFVLSIGRPAVKSGNIDYPNFLSHGCNKIKIGLCHNHTLNLSDLVLSL